MSIPAVLLAAGKGTRLRPLTTTTPKCLVPINGRPLLDIWLETCVSAEFDPIIINTHYMAESVIKYIHQSIFSQKVLLSHENKLLGTGGTLLAQSEILQNGTFFVAHADNLSVFDMESFLSVHARRPVECIMTMLLFETPTPESCGIVKIDSRGIVQEFYEKKPGVIGNLANGAVYLMEPEVLSLLRRCAEPYPDISLDLIPLCMRRILSFHDVLYHRDIGTMESYIAAQHEFSELQIS